MISRFKDDVLAFIRPLAQAVHLDSAVSYILLSRLWGIPASVVTMLLLVRCLSPDDQGFYYTFGSITGLTIFFELGFFLVILNLTSNEFSLLELDSKYRLTGNPENISRIISLGRFCFKWYGAAATLFILIVTPVGYIFFSQKDYPEVNWQLPWLTVVALTGLNLFSSPFLTILEGCNQVSEISKVRFFQGVCGSLILWAGLLMDVRLWALVLSITISVSFNSYIIFNKYRDFFIVFLDSPRYSTISWRNEIWPMQWRISLSGLVNYFVFSLFNPLMFHYFGAKVAGQMGMTRSVVGALQGIGMAWISAKTPMFGMLVGNKDYDGLDRLWFRISTISVIMVSIGAACAYILILMLNAIDLAFAKRFLTPLPTGLFLFSVIIIQVSQCFSAYLRAHVQEPILFMSLVTSILCGFLVWQLGMQFGPTGAAAANLGVWILGLIWEGFIWAKCRRDWHRA